jgi:retron-type reverse transcriptase
MKHDSAVAEPMLTSEGSAEAVKESSADYYREVRRTRRLRNAWRIVYENGRTSKSEETRLFVKEFSIDVDTHLDRISKQLREKRFKFPPAVGILSESRSGKPRPIVKSPIISRIVQRAILDTLQQEPSLDNFYKIPTSFGGIKGKGLGVPGALGAAWRAMKDGASFFIRSDIEGFFTKIPRHLVLDKIKTVIHQPDFDHLLAEATRVELENMTTLREKASLFPSHDLGVAQGCCLSPLFGNILLEGFDRALNGRGITCLRYIDDFLILGPNRSKAVAAFGSAQTLLAELGLTAYDPSTRPDKAEMGNVKDGLKFLGCDLSIGFIRPSRESRTKLLTTIEGIFKTSIGLMGTPALLPRTGRSVTDTLIEAGHVLQGWGNQYSFCNDRGMLKDLDSKIDSLIAYYLEKYRDAAEKLKKAGNPADFRRLLGVHLLADSKFAPVTF